MIIREASTYDNTNYIASLVLVCGIACTITMLRFKGFKVKFNLTSRNKVSEEYYEDVPVVSYTKGVYTSNREEFYGNGSLADPPKRINPSMVKLPEQFEANPTIRPTKSTSDLIQNNNDTPPTLRQSTPNVSMNPKGESSNNRNSANVKELKNKEKTKKQEKEQKILEKKRLAEEKKRLEEEKKRLEEEKKRDKLAAQAQAKEEKERKAKEKLEAQKQAKQDKAKKEKDKNKDKTKVKDKTKETNKSKMSEETKPADVKQPVKRKENPLAQRQVQNQLQNTQGQSYSTNTLESSISKSSGPPAYVDTKPKTEVAKKEVVKNQRDDTGNTSFSKPIDEGSSWDLISQHRQQISRPVVNSGGKPKQTVLDLQYTTGRSSVEI